MPRLAEDGATQPAPGEGLDAGLFCRGCTVFDDFLAPARVRELTGCAGKRRARGDFAAARVGAGGRPQRRAEIRGDDTCWIAPPLFAAECMLLADLERLRLELNRRGLLGLVELELHYAWYPPGAGYARHVDQPQGRDQRQVSLVLYLNDAWAPDAGGQLRLFDAGNGHRDIEPVAGRLVCFRTPGQEHEVLPTRRDRLSVAGWFRRRS